MTAINTFPCVAASVLFLCGCGDAIHERLVGPYRLIAVDADEELNIARYEGDGISAVRIGPVVTDVGWNERYIAAAVRPEDKPGTPPSFYYLDIAKDSGHGNPIRAVTGPLTKHEFDAAKQTLGLPEFKRHFPHLR